MTCAAVCRGKQHPNSLSCDVPSAVPSYLSSMIDRVVLECGENAEMKDTLKKHAVICSEFFIIICIPKPSIYLMSPCVALFS